MRGDGKMELQRGKRGTEDSLGEREKIGALVCFFFFGEGRAWSRWKGD